jgi:hypothetical protein
MLPLVKRIVADLLGYQQRLGKLLPEKNRLDHRRRSLAWPERARRYQLQEEIGSEERNLGAAVSELDNLGLILLDREIGLVGFPTLVNNQGAFFSWLPGEEKLVFWHFVEDTERRPVPASWMKKDSRRKAKN